MGLLYVGVKVLGDGVEGPCLHRPENWLVRQLNDDPKLVYKVGFIPAQKLVTPCSGEGSDFLWML
jgi:hypothetical protein